MHIAVTSSFLILARQVRLIMSLMACCSPPLFWRDMNFFFFFSYGYYVQSSPLIENAFSETCLGQRSTWGRFMMANNKRQRPALTQVQGLMLTYRFWHYILHKEHPLCQLLCNHVICITNPFISMSQFSGWSQCHKTVAITLFQEKARALEIADLYCRDKVHLFWWGSETACLERSASAPSITVHLLWTIFVFLFFLIELRLLLFYPFHFSPLSIS